MIRAKIIIGFLVLSLFFNGFLLKLYFDEQSNKIELEKAIINNEFSERTKEWRNFKIFVSKLSKNEDESFPVSEKQSDLYWELATPMESVVMKVTNSINAEYSSYNDYLKFIKDFDREYKKIVNLFKSKLPLMNNEQLVRFSSQLNKCYDMYINEGMEKWGVGGDVTLDIKFQPNNIILNQVINELTLIRKELEAVE